MRNRRSRNCRSSALSPICCGDFRRLRAPTFRQRPLACEADVPSETKKQARTMAAAAHNPAFAKKVGIPQGVAEEFNEADTGSKLLSSAMKEEFNEPVQRARSR